jgi:hypothetical protein
MAPRRSVPSAGPAVGLNRRLRRWLARELLALRPVVEASARASRAEHRRKQFTSYQQVCLLLFHGLAGRGSLRQSYEQVAACPGLVAASGLGVAGAPERLGVSFSQVAASNGTRPAAVLVGAVDHLVARLRRVGADRPGGDPLLGSLVIQDSTFLRLRLRLAHWLPPLRHPTVSGVRVQVWLHPRQDRPEVVDLTTVKLNDHLSWDRSVLGDPARLAALAGLTIVVDRGSYRHTAFRDLLAAGVHVVTRRYPGTSVTVEAARPLQPPLPDLDGGRIAVVADQRVTLGTPATRTGVVLPGWRLVTAELSPRLRAGHRSPVPRRYEILTDRWDLDAAEVVQAYLWRWQIELFFRWLKHHLHLPHLLGHSENAVELSVWLAILVHLLALLAARALGLPRRSPLILARLTGALIHLDPTHDPDPPPTPAHPSLPGFDPQRPPPT